MTSSIRVDGEIFETELIKAGCRFFMQESVPDLGSSVVRRSKTVNPELLAPGALCVDLAAIVRSDEDCFNCAFPLSHDTDTITCAVPAMIDSPLMVLQYGITDGFGGALHHIKAAIKHHSNASFLWKCLPKFVCGGAGRSPEQVVADKLCGYLTGPLMGQLSVALGNERKLLLSVSPPKLRRRRVVAPALTTTRAWRRAVEGYIPTIYLVPKLPGTQLVVTTSESETRFNIHTTECGINVPRAGLPRRAKYPDPVAASPVDDEKERLIQFLLPGSCLRPNLKIFGTKWNGLRPFVISRFDFDGARIPNVNATGIEAPERPDMYLVCRQSTGVDGRKVDRILTYRFQKGGENDPFHSSSTCKAFLLEDKVDEERLYSECRAYGGATPLVDALCTQLDRVALHIAGIARQLDVIDSEPDEESLPGLTDGVGR